MERQADGRGMILRNTGIAVIAATVLNVVLYFIGQAAGWVPDPLPESAGTFSLMTVIISTAVPLAIAGGLLMILNDRTRNPLRIFVMIAAIVFIMSLFAPLTVAGTTVAFRMLLVAMHVVAAVIGVGLLIRGVREPEGDPPSMR